MEKKLDYDVIIIGGGPAAFSAAIYASRGNLKTAFIEKGAPGGKMVNTFKIENWVGDEFIAGPDLAIRMFAHAQKFGAKHIYGEVVDLISHAEEDKEVILSNGKSYHARAIVIATGMVNRRPTAIKNLDQFEHKGVSYCAICDGPIFGKKPSMIIGGGNSAVEEGAYLASVASEVHIFVREDHFIAEKSLVDELMKKPNVKVHLNSSIISLHGENSLEYAMVNIDGQEEKIEAASLFPYIGFLPAANFARKAGVLEANGFIQTNENMQTKVANIYAAGDIRVKDNRQIVTAASDGAIAGKVLASKL